MARQRHRTFFQKILFPLAGALTAVTLVFFGVYAAVTSRTVPGSVREGLDNQTEILALSVDDMYDSLSYIGISDLIDMDFYEALLRIHYNANMPSVLAEAYDKVVVKLVTNKMLQAGLNITYADLNGYYYSARNLSERPGGRIFYVTPDALAPCARSAELSRNPSFMDISTLPFVKPEEKRFGMVLRVRSPREPIGYLILENTSTDGDEIFASVSELGAVFAVTGETGETIYASDTWSAPDPEALQMSLAREIPTIRDADGARWIVSARPCRRCGCTVWCLYPNTLITDEIRRTMLPVVLAGIAFVALGIGIAYVLSRRISRPIARLTQAVRETSLEQPEALDSLVRPQPADEIEYLGNEYAQMVGRLRETMDEKITLVEQREAQRYQFLQYQINPHFIYNTLNMIGIMGVEAGADDVYDACQSTAGILRYSLSDSRLESTFREEFAIMERYLHLMQMRYESRMTYEISLEKTLETWLLPRFTLQPFVENIFEHAFGAAHREVTIWLGAYTDADGWKIVIRDNGRGMEPEQLEYLNGIVESEEMNAQPGRADTGRIGIKNTLMRLDIFFEGKLFYQFITGENGGCTLILGGPKEDLRGEKKDALSAGDH